jgi:enoyl-CoA hydratase
MADQRLRIEDQRGVVSVTMTDGANALSEPLVEALRGAVARLRDDGAPAMLLRSSHPSLFCPGWDLKRLAGAGYDDVRRFLENFSALILDLFSYPGPTAALIEGHAVAGGCLMAMACDFRVMAIGQPRIGLSEVNLGVPVPAGCVEMLRARLSPSVVEEMLFLGDGYPAQRAAELGVVQRAKAAEGLEATAAAEIRRLSGKPRAAYARTKAFLFGGVWRRMRNLGSEADAAFLESWFDPETQERVAAIAQSLGR